MNYILTKWKPAIQKKKKITQYKQMKFIPGLQGWFKFLNLNEI